MRNRRMYMIISLLIIIISVLIISINLSKNRENKNNIINNSNNIEKIYKKKFENQNNNVSEEEKKIRIEEAENAIKEFGRLPLDTPYEIYDKLYGEIADKYIEKLPSEEYVKYFDKLNDLEKSFLYNPNRQY